MANTPKKDIGPIWPTSLACFADHIPIKKQRGLALNVDKSTTVLKRPLFPSSSPSPIK